MLTVEVRIVGQVAILDCAGRLTLGGDGAVKFRNAIRNILSMYYKQILLNFKDVQYIDNSGIGELVSTLTAVNNAGGKLRLACLQKRVHDLLQITRLYSVFDVSETVEEALKKFGE
jgi:anti-sigma B factor antagonist